MSLFTACSDDDPDYSTTIDQEMVGDYKGALDVTVGGAPSSIPQKISLAKAGATSVNLVISNFSFGGMPLGDIKLLNCQLEQDGNKYTCERKEDITLAAPIGTVPAQVAIVIEGGKVTVSLDIDWNNIPVEVVYKGTRLNGSESKEAKITEFIFDRKVAAADSLVTETVIDEATKSISIYVVDTIKAEYLKLLVPTIKISDKATLSPASGEKQDFNAPVKYTVVAEDGTVVEYTASVAGNKYDFETWSNKGVMYKDIFQPVGWATCNDAVGLIKNLGFLGGITYKGDYPVRETNDCVTGEKAVLMESVDTKGGNLFGQVVPKVTAGTAFLGSFDAMAAVQDPMATTSFGMMYDRKPIEVKGFFKYTAGADFYNEKGEKIDTKDQCSIAAVLYEVANSDETLDGNTIYKSESIVASAMFYNGGQAEYAPFSLKLDYKKQYAASKKYKFAVIFSASKDGAAYQAAVGSKLYVDNVSIVCE